MSASFVISTLVGIAIGVVVMCMFTVASHSDKK